MKPKHLEMTLDLNVLNHLGINLYSNVPSVLAEVVANAWDADAEQVSVNLGDGEIVIQDNGHGMTFDEINAKYLTVGYERRKNGEEKSKKFNRPVMGRKGIGKLSLFSVASEIQVETKVAGKNPQAFLMKLSAIEESIEKKKPTYKPDVISTDNINFEEGTRITIRELKKNLTGQTSKGLRKRLARRFSIIGERYKFRVFVDDEEITVKHRDYFHKVQYMWTFGESNRYEKEAIKADYHEHIDVDFYSGWIGTMKESGDLKDEDGESLSKIVVMMRGKIAHEDILDSFGERGVYASYIIGEIHADFLDEDDEDDIATSSRQTINEDEERFVKLKEDVHERLKTIQGKWTDLRKQGGVKQALKDAAVKEWYEKLDTGPRKQAEKLFGKINQTFSRNIESRNELFRYGILAFESLRSKENIEALDSIDVGNLAEFGKVFEQIDALEASFYHQIVRQRIGLVEKLDQHVSDNAKEKIIQKHLFNHLWLLGPSWERATSGTEYMERNVLSEFSKINAKLSSEEKNARIDIKYRTAPGKHIIVELKRASVSVSALELMNQVDKYRSALRKLLDKGTDTRDEMIEIVCIVGKPLKDYSESNGKEKASNMLNSINARVKTYQDLIENAYQEYSDYLKKSKEVGELNKLLERIGSELSEG